MDVWRGVGVGAPPPSAPPGAAGALWGIIASPGDRLEGQLKSVCVWFLGWSECISAPGSGVALRGPEGGRIYKETGGEVFAFRSIKVEGGGHLRYIIH